MFKVIMGAAGTGKALPMDELILTPNGWVRNDSLVVGDIVIDREGQPTKILAIYDHLDLNMYELSLHDGTKVIACEDHWWVLLHRNNEVTLQTKDIKIDKNPDFLYSIPPCDAIDFNESKELEIDPYLMGRLITKKIPTEYLLGSIEQRIELLRGLMDKRGSIKIDRKGFRHIIFKSPCEVLSQSVMDVVRSLGGVATMAPFPKRGGYKVSIDIGIHCFGTEKGIKAQLTTSRRSKSRRKIVHIRYVGKQPGRCISVDNQSQTYIIRDYIITHNSTLIKNAIAEDPKYGIKTASTGIAAINLQDESSDAHTINSLLGYYDTQSLLTKVANEEIYNSLRDVTRSGYKRIILDEMSMVEAAQLSLIHRAICNYNKRFNQDLGLTLVGDFGQLPTVAGRPCFLASCWSEFNQTTLKDIKRQDNKEFVNALLNVRANKPKDCIDWVADNIGLWPRLDKEFQGTTFFSTNKAVDAFNTWSMNKLKGSSQSYRSTSIGYQRPEWKNIPDVLELKEGALVVLLCNNSRQGYANGDLGWVREMRPKEVLVELKRNGNSVYIDYRTAKADPKVGSITYIPLRAAWGMTIHRSQGLTLDNVQIELRNPNGGPSFMSRTHGMLYVALSRCRTPGGLRLVGSKDDFINSCHVDPIFNSFI